MRPMKTTTLDDYKRRMQRVLNHIRLHLDDPLQLEELAGIACLSPYHFHRVFTGMMGETVKDYVRRLRLERAAAQLGDPALPVIEIALGSGYESHEAFSRAFRQAFGQSPSGFRGAGGSAAAMAPSGAHFGVVKHFRSQRRKFAMKVAIKRMPPLRVAYLSHLGPYDAVGETWERFTQFLGSQGYLGGNQMILGLCHDDPEVTPPDKIRYDACVTVDDNFAPFDGIGVKTIEGGDYAVATHQGPHNEVGKFYAALYGQWLPRSGREMRNTPAFEVYLNSPDDTEPSELLTDIYAPLKSVEE
jgi:AraC family transcriptional regulator